MPRRSPPRPRSSGPPPPVSENLTAVGTDEQTTLLVFAGLIGTAVGIAVTGFYRLIDLLQRWVLLGALATPVSDYLLIPAFVALGILACRAATRWGAGGSRGENVPDVMYRVGVKGGVIPLRPVLAKILASAVAIATGGSVGAEGPVIVLGAGAGSRIGRWVRASPNRPRGRWAAGGDAVTRSASGGNRGRGKAGLRRGARQSAGRAGDTG